MLSKSHQHITLREI
jgi:kinesin family member C1